MLVMYYIRSLSATYWFLDADFTPFFFCLLKKEEEDLYLQSKFGVCITSLMIHNIHNFEVYDRRYLLLELAS